MAKLKAKPSEKTTLKPATSKVKGTDPDLFPIVGVGASAGGLEAFEQFLGNIPENSGLAFVIIQHLDPTQKGMLPELLQRITPIKVHQVKDRMRVAPNNIYVIPPNRSMSILNGKLYLFEPLESRGMRLPIDFFFQSLADDQQDLAVGIILSGMGSDGSIGIRFIKEKNGLVMVQTPDNAKFDSMPKSAIESVPVDIVAPANELPEKLISYLRHIPHIKPDEPIDNKDKSALEKIIFLLRAYNGNDFSMYKKSTLYRRIERRMGVHKIEKISSYVNFLKESKGELEILFKELMIGVTNFFRDASVWEKLRKDILPGMINNASDKTILRAWITGCSTGEEAYSLAIAYKEVIENIDPHKNISLQIFATDLDNDAIEIARKGLYPVNISADVSTNRLARFFVKTDESFRVNNEIREMVVFAQHNLIMHPPFINIDIISCRNLLIYMDAELQRKIIGLFYYSLNHEGIMILGNSESIGMQNHLFTTVDSKLKIYKRTPNAEPPELTNFPSSFSRSKSPVAAIPKETTMHVDIQTLADQLLLQDFSPPGVLVNTNGDIVYINGRTGNFLEPAAGKANLNIFAMLREGLRKDFPIAFHQAIMKKGSVALHNLKVISNGSTIHTNLNVQWIGKPEALRGMVMIIFQQLPDVCEQVTKTDKSINLMNIIKESEMEKELQQLREEMQSVHEEVQTSQEELKSTNEELQSSNEELQSTNEELTSSKEEMQSLNEELQTVNAELLSKVEDYTRAENDMKNLLNSTDIATLFLDKELNIRSYTSQATKIFKLIKSDIGRPFTDQSTYLMYPEMTEDANEVLNTLIHKENQIPSSDGQWFSVRIMPYRTFDDRIDGLVITFINISELKHMESKCKEMEKLSNS